MLPFVKNLQEADFLSGALLLLDKPKGWTSFDVVNKVRGSLRKKYKIKNIKVGHSGTLDPMATGLLLICTGKWTKELQHLTGLDKKYSATIRLGIETDTYDAEGQIVQELKIPILTKENLEAVFQKFTGEFEQLPPVYSAIKKDGQRLYDLARAGKEVVVEPRRVKVYALTLVDFTSTEIQIEVHCGSGFYVRSLAHDIGAELGCGAHLSALRRIEVGKYSIEDSMSVEEVVEKIFP